MTCKDCVHYDVCKKHYNEENSALPDLFDLWLRPEICSDFKNKADFVEVRHGHWIKNGKPHDYDITCSLCGDVNEYGLENEEELNYYRYCANCGAKMDLID